MKISLLFIFLLLNFSQEEESNPESSPEQDSGPKVVNSCGNDEFKISSSMPNKPEDCIDSEEPACKFVSITKGDKEKRFCAIILGKYKDDDVKIEVEILINAKIKIEGKGFYNKIEYMLILLCISMLF